MIWLACGSRSASRALPMAGLIVALLVGACGSGGATETPNLDGSSWILTSYTTSDGQTATVPDGVTASIEFAGGTAAGSGGCNQFTGSYTVDGGTISFGPLASTRKACLDASGEVEDAFLPALSAVTSYAIDGDTLTMTGDDQSAELVFSRASGG